MIKIITKSLKFFVSIISYVNLVLFTILGCIYYRQLVLANELGFNSYGSESGDIGGYIIFGFIGLLVGWFVNIIYLGVLCLLIQINETLIEIKNK